LGFIKLQLETMNVLLYHTMLSSMLNIFIFGHKSDLSQWRIVNDGVMGGKSTSSITVDENGRGLFSGDVSLENNGGFASVRYESGLEDIRRYNSLKLKIKGDGKTYQLRVKGSKGDYHQYSYSVETTGEWQTISVHFDKLQPIFRGKLLDIPVFDGKEMHEVGFLIANGVAESFALRIDEISLQE